MHRDLKFESAIDFAHDLVRIPGLSGEEGAVAERVISECKLLRFDDVWSDGIGNVFARVKGRRRAPAIMLPPGRRQGETWRRPSGMVPLLMGKSHR